MRPIGRSPASFCTLGHFEILCKTKFDQTKQKLSLNTTKIVLSSVTNEPKNPLWSMANNCQQPLQISALFFHSEPPS